MTGPKDINVLLAGICGILLFVVVGMAVKMQQHHAQLMDLLMRDDHGMPERHAVLDARELQRLKREIATLQADTVQLRAELDGLAKADGGGSAEGIMPSPQIHGDDGLVAQEDGAGVEAGTEDHAGSVVRQETGGDSWGEKLLRRFEHESAEVMRQLQRHLEDRNWGQGLSLLDESAANAPVNLWMPWSVKQRQTFEQACKRLYQAEKQEAEKLIRAGKPKLAYAIYAKIRDYGIPAYAVQAKRKLRELETFVAEEDARAAALRKSRETRKKIVDNIRMLESASMEQQKEAVDALTAIGDDAVPYLKDSFDHPSPMVRWAVLMCLHQIGTNEIRGYLLQGLSDPNWRVRSAAADLLGSKGWKDEQIVGALIAALRDGDMIVSSSANLSLTRITGRDVPFSHAAAPEDRERVIRSWETWFQQYQADLRDPSRGDSEEARPVMSRHASPAFR